MYNNSKVAKAIRLTMMFGAGAAAAISAPTFAAIADEGAEEVEKIEVTGSRIKRTDMEGANPVTVIGQVDIAKMSVTNVGDLLNNLTSAAGNAANTQTNNGGDSAVRFSLRGIGEQRTLVLVNGRRYVAGGGGANSSVDLNTIPTSIVKRVEVLKDGASSIYGSDAIAGVVNIITRDDFEGVEFKANYGQTSEGDGAQTGFDLTFGASSEKGNVVVSVGYNEQEDVFMGDRDFSEYELRAYSDGSTQQGGSSAPPWSNVDGYPGSANNPDKPLADANQTRGPEYGAWRDRDGSIDSYNYNPVNYLQTPSKRTYASMFANYEISDEVSVFTEATYVETRGNRLIAPEPLAPLVFFGSPAPYSADNYYNMSQGPKDADGNSYEINDWRRRMLETGGRANSRNYKTYRVVVGLEGDLELGDNTYSWEVSYNYGKSDSVEQASGYFNLDRVAEAVGPTGWLDSNGDLGGAPGDTLVCLNADGAVIDGCIPLNIFGQPGTDTEVTAEMLQYVSGNYNTTELGDNRQESIQAIISGDLFEMPAGVVGFAAGYEYRKESGSYTPDSLILQGTTTAGSAVSTAGSYALDEFFFEASLPLLDGVVMAHRLELDLAARYSDYTTFGSNTTTKVGVRWMPVEELMVRATVSEAFRAPSTPELFDGAATSFPEATDPCDGDPSPNANCIATGVPSSGYESGGVEQIPTKIGGASNWNDYSLTPEEADILTVGVVWNPDYIDGFSATVDYWNIELNNAISTVGAQSRLTGCHDRGEYCDTILRFGASSAVPGNIIEVYDYTVNVGGIDTDGVDFEARYAFESGLGDWVIQLDGTYLLNYDKEIAGGQIIEHTGRFNNNHDGFFTELRSNLTVNWSIDDWSVTGTVRYIGGVTETEAGWWTEDFDRNVPSMTTFDLQGNWQAMENVAFTVGVDNVFDEQPPFVYSAFGANTDVTTYNVLGAFYYARATVTF
ncbi:MAG: TonB-dependent receptor [Alteromonadales bacterium]|nr:TonB-dependent receptor [Alteromonadales bacterium]